MKKPAVTTKRSVTFDFLFEGASILTRLIEKLWIKDPNNRESYGQVAGGVGIFCNLSQSDMQSKLRCSGG